MQPHVVQILNNLKKIKPTEIEPLDLLKLNFSNRIIDDKKVNDHHAIIPTGKISEILPFPSQAIYDALLTRLIAVFYPSCVKEVTTIEASSNQMPFQAKGIRIITSGWTILYPRKKNKNTQELPLFEEEEKGSHFPYINEGKTTPPAHFSENTLLGSMETAGKGVEDEILKEALKEKGIGTPATRASIIETLIKRKYIERNKKALTATNLGRFLIALIQDASLKSPELTGEWELKLKGIEKGTCSAVDFMQEIAKFTERLVATSDIFKINYAIYGPCPKCKNPVIKGKKGYGCSKWHEGCSFVLWKRYKEIELNEGQIRSLLQKKIILPPINGMMLILSSEGEILEIPEALGIVKK